jgi:hypothetical protein
MQSNQLQKAINLAKKTGDRLIVFDKAESVSPFVVMSMEEYEKLALGRTEVRGLTENELVDKINRDIAVWKSDGEYKDFDRDFYPNNPPIPPYQGGFHDFEDDDEDDYLEDDEDEDWEDKIGIEDVYKEDFSSPGLKEMEKNIQRKNRFSRGWKIPSDRKKAADEVVGEEEDRQYLEEIPF